MKYAGLGALLAALGILVAMAPIAAADIPIPFAVKDELAGMASDYAIASQGGLTLGVNDSATQGEGVVNDFPSCVLDATVNSGLDPQAPGVPNPTVEEPIPGERPAICVLDPTVTQMSLIADRTARNLSDNVRGFAENATSRIAQEGVTTAVETYDTARGTITTDVDVLLLMAQLYEEQNRNVEHTRRIVQENLGLVTEATVQGARTTLNGTVKPASCTVAGVVADLSGAVTLRQLCEAVLLS